MQVPISRERLVAIERAAVAAWPALETADIDGWLWRYSGGGSQRANSVSALGFQGADADAAIAEAEARYRARGASPLFQVCHVNAPGDLDERLQRRGYRLQEPCTALAKSMWAESFKVDREAFRQFKPGNRLTFEYSPRLRFVYKMALPQEKPSGSRVA